MGKANVTRHVAVSADFAWEKLSAFAGIEKFSPIERSVTEGQGEGMKRTCYLPDGAAIYERLNKVDDTNMHLEYIITEGPFPVQNYVSNVKVKPVDSSTCEISWIADYNVDEAAANDMKNLFEGFYHAIMGGLEGLSKN